MSPAPQRGAALGFFLAAVLSVVAALLPWFRGREPNAPFLVMAAAWAVFGLAMLRRKGGNGPDRAG